MIAKDFFRFSDPGGTRTPNLQNRNLIFYPLNYGAIKAAKIQPFSNYLTLYLFLPVLLLPPVCVVWMKVLFAPFIFNSDKNIFQIPAGRYKIA